MCLACPGLLSSHRPRASLLLPASSPEYGTLACNIMQHKRVSSRGQVGSTQFLVSMSFPLLLHTTLLSLTHLSGASSAADMIVASSCPRHGLQGGSTTWREGRGGWSEPSIAAAAAADKAGGGRSRGEDGGGRVGDEEGEEGGDEEEGGGGGGRGGTLGQYHHLIDEGAAKDRIGSMTGEDDELRRPVFVVCAAEGEGRGE